VWIAAAGDQKTLLREEFPFLHFVELPGYGIKYGKNRAFTSFQIICLIPKILIRIKLENRWLKSFILRERPSVVLSDNRYGLHKEGLFSVFITHQLRIRTPFGKLADAIVQRINYRAINRFSLCWVPDLEGPFSLAGALSHPQKLPAIPTRYIGFLSRFEKRGQEGPAPADAVCDLLLLLSGPEPQRTILEDKLLEQAARYAGRVTLVRGKPGNGSDHGKGSDRGFPAGMRVYNHLPAGSLNTVLNGAGVVVSRPGYSTVMDLMRLGKKAILIPTPGQTEQEYLAAYLSGKRLAIAVTQADFVLSDALAAVHDFPFVEMEPDEGAGGDTGNQEIKEKCHSETEGTRDRLKKEIKALLEKLRNGTQPKR
jgi:hypothetical protein